MTDKRYQLYISEVFKHIEEKKNYISGMDMSDSYLKGKSDALVDILTLMQSEAISYKINLKNCRI